MGVSLSIYVDTNVLVNVFTKGWLFVVLVLWPYNTFQVISGADS